MSAADDMKTKAHDAIQHGPTRDRITKIAQANNITFNKAMKKYFEEVEGKDAA